MTLLITGGCGFLGSTLAADAIRRGEEPIVFDNLSRVGSEQNRAWLDTLGTVRFVRGDVRDADAVAALVRDAQPTVIFHLAGQVAMTTSIADPRADFAINALGSLNVLEAVRAHAPHAGVVYSSTNKVYGDLDQYRYTEDVTRYRCVEHPQGFDEQTPLDFRSPYGCSKGAADQYMLDYARMFDVRTIVFRHSSMYGGRQFATFDQGWIGWFVSEAVRLERGGTDAVRIAGNGRQVRDVLHADDMIALYSAAAARLNTVHGEAFNVGGAMPNSLSLLELFAMLESMTGAAMPVAQGAARHSDQKVFVADVTKATRLLGWTPRVSAREGLARMLDWTRELMGAR